MRRLKRWLAKMGLVLVSRKGVEYLAGFQCRDHKAPKTCYDFPAQGGCCNSCWVRSWAKGQLGLE